MSSPSVSWVCCQLGAREHYAVPRALHRHGRLANLMTDAWVKPASVLRLIPGSQLRRLTERYHPELAETAVSDFTSSLAAHEVWWRLTGRKHWDLFEARNDWFQRNAADAVGDLEQHNGVRQMLFAHSYAALEIFKRAKPRGWTLVLGQIDPGEEHFRIVTRAALEAPEYGPPPIAPPSRYFDRWREECALADRIVVNSEWSRSCLERAGIPAAKLTVVPLAFESAGNGATAPAVHQYPEAFTTARPLRLLFVGQVAIAKGIKALLDATTLLTDVPFELTLVGETAMRVPAEYREHRALRWVGPLSRSEVMTRYQQADALVFPSLSDGFGMAQIEAQGWRLPIIASRSCGQVVHHGVNGLLLDQVTPQAIAGAITTIAGDPPLLARFSATAAAAGENGIAALGSALLKLE